MRLLLPAFVASVLCVLGDGALAQDFPNKPVRLVVPSGPGTTSDGAARVLATEMAKGLGQPVVVENREGAAQVVGLEHVAKIAPADGYTLIIATAVAPLPVSVKDLRFEPLRDLVPFIDI